MFFVFSRVLPLLVKKQKVKKKNINLREMFGLIKSPNLYFLFYFVFFSKFLLFVVKNQKNLEKIKKKTNPLLLSPIRLFFITYNYLFFVFDIFPTKYLFE